ncbi:hypothetical protein [Endozoicomonas sp. SCSIO W0465]|uniref:hypothetical protein n=1 Tax=Endozoicomonas sp. SCSIO W0465 TaxID=2918516 RepID=UPI0020762D44|nr:hypothetical protein [Endozoicomonas sp. SCSIO W0465]USE37885.1 hypothetical protein MJO57_06745 [Endozoicomonas sp. SCSIO W0465]
MSPYGENFHNPFNDYRFPKVLVRVVYHQEPEQSGPLDLSDKTKAYQQSDENILFQTGQSELRIDRVWSVAVEASSQSRSINANHSPIDSTLKGSAGSGFSGMGQSTLQISSVDDCNLHQLGYIPDQDCIDTFSRLEAPIAIITPQLDSAQLQQNTSSARNVFKFNASASVSGESLTISPDKASQKFYRESDKGKGSRKASQRAYAQSDKGKATRKAYRESDRGKACQKAYEQSEKRKAGQKAYRESDKGKASQKAYRESDRGKASQKAYRESDRGKASRKAYCESDKGKACRKVYEQSEKRKAYQKAYRESDEGKAYHKAYQKAYAQSEKRKASRKAYRESDIGKAYNRVYHKAYLKVLRNTGDREQAKTAGRQAAAFIKESNKAKNSELESTSISPLPSLAPQVD